MAILREVAREETKLSVNLHVRGLTLPAVAFYGGIAGAVAGTILISRCG